MAKPLKTSMQLTTGARGDPAELFRQWPERTRNLTYEITRQLTRDTFEELLKRLPVNDFIQDYRQSLTFGEVRGGEKGLYAIYVNPKARRVRRLDMSTTLLYVHSKLQGRRAKPDILVLQANNPWTTDTIPYQPSNRDALLVSRRASRGLVTKTAEHKERTRTQWTKELRQAGVRKFAPPKTIPRGLEAMPDFLLEAMRLEFGLGPGRSRPHWRPAILGIRRRLPQFIRRNPKLVYALTRPEFRQWRRWPQKMTTKVRFNDVRGFIQFQRRLGLRLRIK